MNKLAIIFGILFLISIGITGILLWQNHQPQEKLTVYYPPDDDYITTKPASTPSLT